MASAATMHSDQLLAYDPGDFFDEAVDPVGRARAGYETVLRVVAECEPSELADRVERAMCRMGATFGDDDTSAFPVCPIPRLIHAREWEFLERGLAQRAQALNAFITDVYSERQIVRAGVIGGHIVAGADHFDPAMMGLPQPGGPAPIIGFDLVRGAEGELRVLEDNLRTPSGLAYAAAVRRAVEVEFPLTSQSRVGCDPTFEPLRL